MDNASRIDLAAIGSALRTNDVVVVRFVIIAERLLLDFRASEIDGPLVRVVQPAKSVEERYQLLKQLRPRFDAPARIVAIGWPRFAASLRTTGLWDAVLERISGSGHPEAVRQAAAALDELCALERARQREAIAGTGFRTLWSATKSLRQE